MMSTRPSKMKLVEDLNIELADLMPVKGVAVMVPDEGSAYRISERLHAAMKAKAVESGVSLSRLLRQLRDELHASG